MLYTEASARDRIRTLDGRRVFYLTPGDRLTAAARDYLNREQVAILTAPSDTPAQYETLFGAVLTHKPEHMTHLTGNVLVEKTHPRIALRGQLDELQAQILLTQRLALQEEQAAAAADLGQSLDFVRRLLRCEVLGEPVPEAPLGGLTAAQLREHSHHPERYYGVSHFMPAATDGALLLQVNLLRTLSRRAELSACRAFCSPEAPPAREDLLRALNRLSSFYWILIIRLKSGDYERRPRHDSHTAPD